MICDVWAVFITGLFQGYFRNCENRIPNFTQYYIKDKIVMVLYCTSHDRSLTYYTLELYQWLHGDVVVSTVTS